MQITELPTNKTGLRQLPLSTLVTVGLSLNIPGADTITKSNLIDRILEHQAKAGTPEQVAKEDREAIERGLEADAIEEDEQKDEGVSRETQPGEDFGDADMAADIAQEEEQKAAAAKDVEETPIAIEATPKWLLTSATWVYLIVNGEGVPQGGTTSLERAYGRACEVADRVTTKEHLQAVRKLLKDTGVAQVADVSIVRARAF